MREVVVPDEVGALCTLARAWAAEDEDHRDGGGGEGRAFSEGFSGWHVYCLLASVR